MGIFSIRRVFWTHMENNQRIKSIAQCGFLNFQFLSSSPTLDKGRERLEEQMIIMIKKLSKLKTEKIWDKRWRWCWWCWANPRENLPIRRDRSKLRAKDWVRVPWQEFGTKYLTCVLIRVAGLCGGKGAPAEKFRLGRKFLAWTYAILSWIEICCDLRTFFLEIFGQRKCLFG